jgi:sporulation protein YlmC with PRC-barrel domain
MDKIRMILIGMLMMVAFVAAPVYGAEGTTDEQRGADQQTGVEGAAPGEHLEGQDQQLGEQQFGQQEGSLRVSELMDKSIQDQQGNDLGSVSDLVVSQQGEVEFIVLSEGTEFLGIGEEEFIPIPWDQVDVSGYQQDADAIMVNVDEQTLRDAPKFTDDQWQTFTQGDMDQEVRGYYGTDAQQHDMPQTGVEGAAPGDQWGTEDPERDTMEQEQPGPGQEQQRQY